jgi:TRAP-type mannitol/chloroaromatic compound transport system substrate-binding protein
MKRRDFLTRAGAGSLIAGSALSVSNLAKAKPTYKWKMVSFKQFRDNVTQWHNISELAYYNARNL